MQSIPSTNIATRPCVWNAIPESSSDHHQASLIVLLSDEVPFDALLVEQWEESRGWAVKKLERRGGGAHSASLLKREKEEEEEEKAGREAARRYHCTEPGRGSSGVFSNSKIWKHRKRKRKIFHLFSLQLVVS